MPLKVHTTYYAHAMGYYGSVREETARRSIETILQTKLICPNAPEHAEGFTTEGMAYFDRLVREKGIDSVVFETFDDDKVGAGVAYEVALAQKLGLQVWRLRHFDGGSTLGHWGSLSLEGLGVLTREDTRARNRVLLEKVPRAA